MEVRERKRNSYSRVDEAKMWMFLYRKLREASPAAREPKGLRIWSEYINECQVSRTVDSLTTRFRRHMIGNLHNADLSCDVMMFLYRQLRITMDPDVKIMLQLKFSIEIVLNENGYVKTYKKSVQPVLERHLPTATKREHQPEADSSRKKSAPSNSRAQRESDVLSDEGSLTPPPRKRSSLDFTRQIHDVLVDTRFETRYKRQPEEVEVVEIHDEDFDSDEEDCFDTHTPHGSTTGASKIIDQPSSSKQQNLVSHSHHYANVAMHPSSSNPGQNSLREPQMAESPNVVPDSCAKETITNASEDQFSSSDDELDSSNVIEVANVPEGTSNADKADVASTSAGNGLQMTPQLGTIVVSETSDTCELAYQRLYNALNNSSNVPVGDSNASGDFQRSFTEWQSRIEQMLEKYEIPSVYTKQILDQALKAQKNLWQRGLDNYEKSLCALDYQLEKLIQDVKQRCEPSAPRPISSVVTIQATSNAPISVTLVHTDSSKVPLTLRKQKVKEVFPPLDSNHYSFAIEEIVDRLERLESLAAQMPENYEDNMLKVKEAVKERINQIRLRRNH